MQCLGVYHWIAVGLASFLSLVVGLVIGTALTAKDAFETGVSLGMDVGRDRK
jgi:hypothetical protein